MIVAHTRLRGLDEDRILAVVLPILRAHGVEGVELVWRTDRGGWVLELTIERPDSRVPGAGITVDLCSEISRDLSAALDVSDLIPARYRLEVGSPGLERALYNAHDYERFAGQGAKLKLKEARNGQRVIHGTLRGCNEHGQITIETDQGPWNLELDAIESAHLVFAWNTAGQRGAPQSGRRGSSRRGPGARGSQR